MTTPPHRPSGEQPQSGREKMRDAVDQLMKQVNDQKKESRAEVIAARERAARRQKIRGLQAAVLGIVLVISTLFAIPQWRRPFAPPQGAAAERDARRAIIFASQLVEQRIRTSHRAPQSFDELGVPLTGIDYRRLDSLAYVISTTVAGHTVSFRRGDDAARFLAGP